MKAIPGVSRASRTWTAGVGKVRRTRQKQRVVRLYSQFVGSGDLCFDIGAHVGDRTAALLSLGARVVAVEPQERCLEQLRRRFGRADVSIVPSAVGASEGEGELMRSTIDTTSSLSAEWIGRVTESGRFADLRWADPIAVAVTTLDVLIARFGVPTFCKVDVEGFEGDVLKGLSRPVKILSLEFTPEFFDSTAECVRRLEFLGMTEFNYSLGESLEFALPVWVDGDEALATVRSINDSVTFGDVYARLPT